MPNSLPKRLLFGVVVLLCNVAKSLKLSIADSIWFKSTIATVLVCSDYFDKSNDTNPYATCT